MQLLTKPGDDILPALCKFSKKWGMFFHGTKGFEEKHTEVDRENILQAAAWLPRMSRSQQADVFAMGEGYLLFDSEEEMMKAFNQTIGDDGATDLNNYAGPRRVFAVTCSPDGELQTENT